MVSVVFLAFFSGVLSVVVGLAPARRSRVVRRYAADDEDVKSLKERVLELKSQVADLEPKAAVKEEEKKSPVRPAPRPVLSDGQLNLEALLCRLDVKKASGDELSRFVRFCGFAEMAGREEEFVMEAMVTAFPYQRLPAEMPLTRLLLLAQHDPSNAWLEQAGLAEKFSAVLNNTDSEEPFSEGAAQQWGDALYGSSIGTSAGNELEIPDSVGSVESRVIMATRSLWVDWVQIAAAKQPFEPRQREALVATVGEEGKAVESLGLSSMTLARKMKQAVEEELSFEEMLQEEIQPSSFLELRFRERLRELTRREPPGCWSPEGLDDLYFSLELAELERTREKRAVANLFTLVYDAVVGSNLKEEFKAQLIEFLGPDAKNAQGEKIDFEDDAQLRTAFATKGNDLLAGIQGFGMIFSTLFSFLFLYLIFNFVLGPIGGAAFDTFDRLSTGFSSNLDLLYGPLLNRITGQQAAGSSDSLF